MQGVFGGGGRGGNVRGCGARVARVSAGDDAAYMIVEGKEQHPLHCVKLNMQSSDSVTTDEDIENVSDPIDDFEGGEQAWTSVSNSQSAQDGVLPPASCNERSSAADSPLLRSPQSSQQGRKIIDLPRCSPPQSLRQLQPASPPSASTFMRSDSQSSVKSAAAPSSAVRESPRQTRQPGPSSPLKSPAAPQQSTLKSSASQAADEARAGDTLHLDSATLAVGEIEIQNASVVDLSAFTNFALYVTPNVHSCNLLALHRARNP
jgi:hypothetical protein